jgi:hypothetical protein
MPLLLISPPFAEGILGGNVQILLFALFTALFVAQDRSTPPFHPMPRDPADPTGPTIRDGLMATTIAAFKVGQLHPWLYVAVRRWRAALVGVVIFGLVVLATVPITGIALWADWVDQVRRAADPGWAVSGLGLGRYIGPLPATLIAIACILAVAFVPRHEAGAWVGVLSVIGSLSLRTYGLLFLAPAGLAIRRELGLLAFALIGTFTEAGMWAGIWVIAGAWLASTRWPRLRERRQTTSVSSATAGAAP